MLAICDSYELASSLIVNDGAKPVFSRIYTVQSLESASLTDAGVMLKGRLIILRVSEAMHQLVIAIRITKGMGLLSLLQHRFLSIGLRMLKIAKLTTNLHYCRISRVIWIQNSRVATIIWCINLLMIRLSSQNIIYIIVFTIVILHIELGGLA